MTKFLKQFKIKDCLKRNKVAYSNLFKIENYIREIILKTLNKNFPDWWNQLKGDSNLQKLAMNCEDKQLIEKQSKIYYFLPYIYYAEMNDLIKIITYNKFWRYFKDFGSNSGKFKKKFDNYRIIRNKVMHSKPISESEHKLLDEGVAYIEECYPGIDKILYGCEDPNTTMNAIIDEMKIQQHQIREKELLSTEVFEIVSCLFWWSNDKMHHVKINNYYNSVRNLNDKIISTPDRGKKLLISNEIKQPVAIVQILIYGIPLFPCLARINRGPLLLDHEEAEEK